MRAAPPEPPLAKLIAFTVAEYTFALPIAQVLQVVQAPPTPDPTLRPLGLVQLGRHTLRVLELHRWLDTPPPLPTPPPLWLITCTATRILSVIPLQQPPGLLELPPDQMQPLPRSPHATGMLAISSHIAVCTPVDRGPTTLFLLDLDQTLNAVPPARLPTPKD